MNVAWPPWLQARKLIKAINASHITERKIKAREAKTDGYLRVLVLVAKDGSLEMISVPRSEEVRKCSSDANG